MIALELLNYLGALEKGEITKLGLNMAELAIDPQLAKMIIASCEFKCSKEIIKIACMLSVPKVYHENNQVFYKKYRDNTSDHLTLLNIYNEFEKSNF